MNAFILGMLASLLLCCNVEQANANAHDAMSVAKEHEKALVKQKKNAQREMEKAKKTTEKARKKEMKRAMEDKKKRVEMKKAEDKKIRNKMKKKAKKDRAAKEADKNRVEYERLREMDGLKQEEKKQRALQGRDERDMLMSNWETHRDKVVLQEKEKGKYAYLYKSPAWPMHALFWENKAFLNVQFDYTYATDAYGSCRGGSGHDVSTLEFGQCPIKLKDISLASRLLKDGKVNPEACNLVVANFLKAFADETLRFNGKQESMSVSFDFARYLRGRDVAVGVHVPIVYKKNRLEIGLPVSGRELEFNSFLGLGNDPTATLNNIPIVTIQSQSGQAIVVPANTALKQLVNPNVLQAFNDYMIEKILKGKGIEHVGGSSGGIGDIELFGNIQLRPWWADKVIFGLRVAVPTGKEADLHRLWSPELGCGGFTTVGAYMSALVSYKKFLNPHVLIEGRFSNSANVKRRVPRRVVTPDSAVATEDLGHDLISLGGFVKYKTDPLSDANKFDEFDATVNGFGDKINKIRMTKGAEFEFRLGNMMEAFLLRRGFMDVYYNFRAKAQDEVRRCLEQVDTACCQRVDELNLCYVWDNTQRLEHKLGFEYAYQFDLDARLRVGLEYTFAGKSVPKLVLFTTAFNYSF
ncbi:MAG: hypothetical protein H6679_03790 [Epsilonproteobacteria bacterium]|nr:hypothetical protein [Campylobacterota bacterium]